MNEFSVRDNRRSQIVHSEAASGVQAFRDSLALEYALGLTSGEAEALAQDLTRLRDSKEGFSAVSYRLLRAVHARQRLNGRSFEADEACEGTSFNTSWRARLNRPRKTG